MTALGVVLVAVVALLVIAVYLFKIKGIVLTWCSGEGARRLPCSATPGFDRRVGLGNVGILSGCLGHTGGTRKLEDPGISFLE